MRRDNKRFRDQARAAITAMHRADGARASPPQAWVERAAEIIIDEMENAIGFPAAWDAALRIYRLGGGAGERDTERIAKLREALERIADHRDAGRHDGLPEPYPALSNYEMWEIARAALAATERE